MTGVGLGRRGALAAAAVCLGVSTAHAVKDAPVDKRVYVAPAASWTFFDEDSGQDDDSGYRLGIGKPLNKYLNLEIEAYSIEAEHRSGGAADGGIEGVGASVLLFPARYHSPFFLLVSASAGEYERDATTAPAGGSVVDDFDFGASMEYGFGLLHPLTEGGSLLLRAEYRFRNSKLDDEHDELHDHSVSLGVQLALGERRSDDYTRPGDWRNPDLEPMVAKKPAPPVSKPKPTPKPVDGDDDKDGVRNSVDQCPGTRPGANVLANGCELTRARAVQLDGVNFDFSQATLRPESRRILDRAAQVLKQMRDIRVEVGGHTDRKGSVALNMKLSQARAESVRRYLISKGVAPDRLTARGYGPHYPIAANTKADGSDNPAGRAKNRRVMLKVIRED